MGLSRASKDLLIKLLKKTIAPASKIEYTRPKEISLETEEERRQRKNKATTSPNYQIPETPKVSGIRWGGEK